MQLGCQQHEPTEAICEWLNAVHKCRRNPLHSCRGGRQNDFQTRAHLSAQTAQTLGTNNFAASVERQTSKFGTPTPQINQQFVGNNMIAGAVLTQQA